MISDRQNKECRSVDQTGKGRACVILIQSGTVQINSIDYVLIQYIPIQQIILRRKLCGHGSDKQTRGLRINQPVRIDDSNDDELWVGLEFKS